VRIFIPIISLILFPLIGMAAVNAGMVWEFRSTATASMVNGCGYDSTVASPGTDYSLQDGSQFNGSNLATTNGTTNPCVVTSATHNFVSTDNGNAIHITSGGNFTAGWYEIKSTAGNAATLDRACASTASTSNGVWTVGGACNFGSATLDAQFFATATSPVVSGNIVYFKNGTYTAGSTLTAGTAGTATAPINIIGYNSTRSDAPTGSTRPVINMQATQWTIGGNWNVSYLQVTGSAATLFAIAPSSQVLFSKFTNTSRTAGRIALSIPSAATNTYVEGVEAISYVGRAIQSSSSANGDTIIGSYLHDSDICYTTSATTVTTTLVDNILDGCIAAGFQFTGTKTGSTFIYGNTISGAINKTNNAVGISLATGATNVRVENNIITGWASGITHADSQAIGVSRFNDFFGNTSNASNWTLSGYDITSDPQFTNTAQKTGTGASSSGSVLTDGSATFTSGIPVVVGRDFLYIVSGTGVTAGYYGISNVSATTITADSSLGTGSNIVYQITVGKNFAPGVNMKFKGNPGIFPAANTTGYKDIGAAQRHEYGRQR
jgi:hypothetical protein